MREVRLRSHSGETNGSCTGDKKKLYAAIMILNLAGTREEPLLAVLYHAITVEVCGFDKVDDIVGR